MHIQEEHNSNANMWMSASESSTLGAEEVASMLRVEVRQGLSWQEATYRRQLSG